MNYKTYNREVSLAWEACRDWARGAYPDFSASDYFEAALSHWAHSGGQRVPHLPAGFGVYAHRTSKQADSSIVSESQIPLPLEVVKPKYPPPSNPDFTFIDLFAGIGGFRQAMQSVGGKCVFSSEWDKYAKATYFANYGEMPYGDITQIATEDIPEHDVLCGGFPCQPFSLAGVSKKNSLGRKHGFEDETQGTLFFNIAEILKTKRPKTFFLENVKNLLTHDKKNTFEVIRRTLSDQLGYHIAWKIVDASKWVPQRRERIFIVGYDPKQVDIVFDDIKIPSHPLNGHKYVELKSVIKRNVDQSYMLGPGTWDTLVRHKAHHASIGQGFGYGLHSLPIKKGEVTRTISARYHKDGAEILVETDGPRPRRLTVEEAMQLQGYDPRKFVFPVSNTQAYRQIGNSVAVPAIRETAVQIAEVLKRGS